jgi:hypothetical protein
MLKVKETACGHHQELAASRASYSTFNYNQQIPRQTSRLLLLLLLLSSFLLAVLSLAAPRGGKESNIRVWSVLTEDVRNVTHGRMGIATAPTTTVALPVVEVATTAMSDIGRKMHFD